MPVDDNGQPSSEEDRLEHQITLEIPTHADDVVQSEGDADDDEEETHRHRHHLRRKRSFNPDEPGTPRRTLSGVMLRQQTEEEKKAVLAKIQAIEAQKKERMAALKPLTDRLLQLRDKIAQLDEALAEGKETQTAKERYAMLEEKKEALEEREQVEEDIAAKEAWYTENAILLTPEEERVHRGLLAEAAERKRRQEEDRARELEAQRMKSAKDAGKLQKQAEEEQALREVAMKKLEVLKSLEAKRADLVAAHDTRKKELAKNIKTLEEERKKAGKGEAFLELSERLIKAHEEREEEQERMDAEIAACDKEIAANNLTSSEEQAVRGYLALKRQKQERLAGDTDPQRTQRAKQEYSSRGVAQVKAEEERFENERKRRAQLSVLRGQLRSVARSMREMEKEHTRKTEALRKVIDRNKAEIDEEPDTEVRIQKRQRTAERMQELADITEAFYQSDDYAALTQEKEKLECAIAEIEKNADPSAARGLEALRKLKEGRLDLRASVKSCTTRSAASMSPSGEPEEGDDEKHSEGDAESSPPRQRQSRRDRYLARLYYRPYPSSTPQPLPTEMSQSPTPKKVVGASNRLTALPRRKEVPPLRQWPKLAPDEQKKVNERLFTAVHRKQREKLQWINEEWARVNQPKELPPSDERYLHPTEAALLDRLYRKPLKDREEKLMMLVSEYKKQSKKLTASEQSSINQRLFYERKDVKKSTHAALVHKYIESTQPSFPVLDRETVEELGKRLSKKNGGTR